MRLDLPLPDAGVRIPIYSTFTGLRGVPLITLGYNNAFLVLRLFEDRIEFKVLSRHSRALGDIEMVHARRVWTSNPIDIYWKGTRLTTGAGIIRPDWQAQVLAFFARKEIPLSPQAQVLAAPN